MQIKVDIEEVKAFMFDELMEIREKSKNPYNKDREVDKQDFIETADRYFHKIADLQRSN